MRPAAGPARIIVLADGGACAPNRLDAQIRVGGDAGTSRSHHSARLRELAPTVNPGRRLLLPDAPIVAWWPRGAPRNAGETSIGRIAHRRITDSANEDEPLAALENIRNTYKAGDTDLRLDPPDQLADQLAAAARPRRSSPSPPSPSRAPRTRPAPCSSRHGSS